MRPGGHAFSQLLPEDKALPAPPLEFFEIETAKLHGGWAVWQTFSAQVRGKLLAHEMHASLRKHYEHDVMRDESRGSRDEGKKSDASAPWSAARDKFFGGGKNIAT